MNMQIDSAVKRSRGYWFVDGFTEMTVGGFFIILAALLLFGRSASPDTFTSWFLSMAGEVSIVKLIGLLAVILILWWLKDHFTYPRTGFVRGTRITTALILVILRNIILFLLLPILALLAASLLMTSANSVLASMPVWFPIALGILWSIFFLLSGEWMGLHRFRILGIVVLLAGIGIGIWQLTTGLPAIPISVQPGLTQPTVVASINRTLTSLSDLVLISGAALLISGLVTFLRYRKENPKPYVEDV